MTFSGKNSLRNYNRHIKKCGIIHQCPLCQKEFSMKCRLNDHTKYCKKGKCNYCNEVFNTESDLKSHLICTHQQ